MRRLQRDHVSRNSNCRANCYVAQLGSSLMATNSRVQTQGRDHQRDRNRLAILRIILVGICRAHAARAFAILGGSPCARCARKSFCGGERYAIPTKGYRAYLVIRCFHIRRNLWRIGGFSVVAYSILSTVRLIFFAGGDAPCIRRGAAFYFRSPTDPAISAAHSWEVGPDIPFIPHYWNSDRPSSYWRNPSGFQRFDSDFLSPLFERRVAIFIIKHTHSVKYDLESGSQNQYPACAPGLSRSSKIFTKL